MTRWFFTPFVAAVAIACALFAVKAYVQHDALVLILAPSAIGYAWLTWVSATDTW